MPKEQIRCADCNYCDRFRRLGNARAEFSCNHPDEKYIREYFQEHRLVKMPGSLGHGEKWSDEVPVKTSPNWCPKKRKEE